MNNQQCNSIIIAYFKLKTSCKIIDKLKIGTQMMGSKIKEKYTRYQYNIYQQLNSKNG